MYEGRNAVPDKFREIETFGQFYERVIIDFGQACVKSRYPFINFDKHQIQLLYEAWEEYGVLERPDIAYNVCMLTLKKYTDKIESEIDIKESKDG